MDILKIDYDKIKELLDLAKKENIELTKKSKKNKKTFKNKKFIIKSLKVKKEEKIKETKKKIKTSMKSSDIIKLNAKLIKELQDIENLEETVSSIELESFKKFPVDYGDYLNSISSDSDTYIETFTN